MSTGSTKMKPHVPPKRKSPIKEKYGKNPGGPHTPGAKKKRKIKDGSAEGHKLTGINQ